MKRLKLFFACMLMAVFGVGNVWAVDPAAAGTTLFSENFSSYSANNVPSGSVTTATGRVVYGNGSVTYTCTASGTKIYNENTGGGTAPEILVAKNGGTFVIAGIPSGDAQAITVSWTQNKQSLDVAPTGTGYSGSVSGKPANVGTRSFDITVADGADATFTLTFTGSGTSNVRVDNILVTVKTAGEGAGTPTCATPIFDPAAGTFYGSQEITLATGTDGASIYYTTDGTTPSSTNGTLYEDPFEITATTTIKAIAVKDGANDSEIAEATYTAGEVVTSYSIDFETNNSTAYVNWNFENIVCASTAITAHAGTYYGNTNAKSTASITTKAKYANPGTLTFYISKESGNTTASSWKAQVSEDGEAWTDVETFDAKGMGKGEWNECTADLSSYSNVYVRISYGSSTAIRAIDDIELAAASATPKAAKPTFETGDDFVTSTSVTLVCATEGASIYYTTDGTTPSSTNGTLYEDPFEITATTTIKAIAVADGYDNSPVAEKTFTKVEALESLAALLEATTSTETGYNVVISDWVVTGAISNRAWISNAENTKGILLYKSNHGFAAGKKLNGVVIGTKAKIYQGYPELTSLLASEVTVSDAAEVTPRTTTLAALVSGYNVEQGTLVKLENVTYAAGTGFSDGTNTVALNTQLYGPTMVDGATYNIIGVVRYDNGPVYSIMPRSADDVEQISGGGLPEVDGLAALKAATVGASYMLTLENAVVTLVDGNNAFIEDATAGALIYLSNHGFAAGDKLNGQYEVTTASFNGKFEITAIEAQTGAETTQNAEIPVTTMTIAELNAAFAANESKRIKIVGVNVTDAIANNDRNGVLSDGANTIILYAGKNGVAASQNNNVDIIGYPTFYVTNNANQQQLAVWAQADIKVNEKEAPEISYSPATLTIEEGDAWSAPTFNNPHSLAIASYISSNEAVATVTDGGEIALAGGIGTAVITAHTNGDATYAAGNATYTITVNEAGSYSMSINLSKASYDAAADAEVVWNSSVVTFTADKNDGTKVTNYLAGNYSSGTLIEEVRFYAKNSLSFVPASGVTITKVEWMSTAKGYATKLAAETWTNATVAVDATNDKLVNITPSAAGEFSVTLTDAARSTGITVYYQADAEKAKLTASIAIDDMNMAVGDDDILLSAIAATSNPNKKAISYAVTSGSEYVSITGEGAEAALHAIAEGTATVTATIPDNLGNYTGATKTFTVTVAAAPATLVSIAISGEATALEYTEGQDFNPAGLVVTGTYSDASTAPITEGITWAFDPSPLTQGTTSVSVTATVGTVTSDAFPVNGLTVSAAPVPTSGNIVILAEYNSKFYAMTNSLTSGALAGVEVEKDGSKIVVSSAEDKAAIQWTATVDGDNTTLKDGDDYYIKGSSGASLSLEADPYNWNWDGEKSCYISSAYTNRGLFFSNSGNVFKGYALSNITSDGYAATEVIEIDPEDIVISSKVDPALAYTPASDEITVGDAWSAPVLGYVEGFDGLAAITYESSNEAVATVTDAGVIALAGGTGTATITATFGGNASYLAGSATYTVKVNEPAEDCDGTDDFSTATSESASSYNVARTTTNGWSSVNSALTTINSEARWLTMLGKTSQVGVITSPTLNDGIASLKIRYANTFNESKGVSFRVDIKQGEDIVKTYTITKENSEVEKGTVYTEIIENINVAGDFQMIFTNLCPSNADSNKDRVSIGRLCWSSYSAPEPPTPDYGSYQRNVIENNYGTICLPQAGTIEGATLFEIGKYENEMIYVDEVIGGAMEAGKPYIFQATASQLNVTYTSATQKEAGNANGLCGFYNLNNMDTDDADKLDLEENNGNYILYQNAYWLVSGRAAYINNFRAYIKHGSIQPKSAAPGRRRVAMAVNGEQVATGMESIQPSEVSIQKVMIDGQLFIIRGEKMYNANGQVVK